MAIANKENKKILINSCKGKMSTFGYCTDCNNFYRTSRDDGYCKRTGRPRNYGDKCDIDSWTPICQVLFVKKSRLLVLLPLVIPALTGCFNHTTTTLVLVRMAETEGEVQNIVGRPGEITDLGKQHAIALGKSFSSLYHFDQRYYRTFYTTHAILENMENQEIIEGADLGMYPNMVLGPNYGAAYGMSKEEATAQYGGVEFPTDFGGFYDIDYTPGFTSQNTYKWRSTFELSLHDIANNQDAKGKTILVEAPPETLYWAQFRFPKANLTAFESCGYAELEFDELSFESVKLKKWVGESPTIE